MIDLQKKTFQSRFAMAQAIDQIKTLFFDAFVGHGITSAWFDKEMYNEYDRIYVIPSDGSHGAFEVIGFEIKTEHGSSELELIYIKDGRERGCFTFETLNEESLWYSLSRVIDYYDSKVWKDQ